MCRIVIGVFEDRQAAEDLSGVKHLPPDAANHVLQAELVSIRVITLGSGKFPETNRHHLVQAAFDLTGKIRVPLHTGQEHHAVTLVSAVIHESVDAFRCFSQGNDIQRADDRATHRLVDDSVVGQHIGLTFRGGGPMAAHRRKDERSHPRRFPVFDDGSCDRGDVGNAPAAHSDRDTGGGFQPRRKWRLRKLPAHFGRNVADRAIREILAH